MCGFDVLMMMCWTSLQVSFGFASNARAMIAAAIGALALVPVCFVVQPWCKSVVTTWGSEVVPELNKKTRKLLLNYDL